jgi:hypothetical protein
MRLRRLGCSPRRAPTERAPGKTISCALRPLGASLHGAPPSSSGVALATPSRGTRVRPGCERRSRARASLRKALGVLRRSAGGRAPCGPQRRPRSRRARQVDDAARAAADSLATELVARAGQEPSSSASRRAMSALLTWRGTRPWAGSWRWRRARWRRRGARTRAALLRLTGEQSSVRSISLRRRRGRHAALAAGADRSGGEAGRAPGRWPRCGWPGSESRCESKARELGD